MAITVTQRGALNTGDDAATIFLEGVVLTSGKIYVAFVCTSFAGSSPSVRSIEATGLSMVKIATTGSFEDSIDGGQARVEAWMCKCTASGTVELTIDLDGTSDNSDAAIYELGGVNNANDTSAVLQAVCGTSNGTPATSTTIAMATFGTTGNRPLAFIAHLKNEVTNADSGGGYTELLDANHDTPKLGFEVQWHSSVADASPDWSWGSSSEFGGIALELVMAIPFPIHVLIPPPPGEPDPEQEFPRPQVLADWFGFPTAQSLGVLSTGDLSKPVEFTDGDEMRITISGPGADQPQVRLSLGGKHIH